MPTLIFLRNEVDFRFFTRNEQMIISVFFVTTWCYTGSKFHVISKTAAFATWNSFDDVTKAFYIDPDQNSFFLSAVNASQKQACYCYFQKHLYINCIFLVLT